ncbi:hypothetical protein F4604DRAFT_1920608 [Suillus subluteus]|nr:hypothetical protein F4604DRAFT_1920608 [Suillus subluteus]
MPFPVGFDASSRQPQVELLSISSMTLKTLKHYCRIFGLKVCAKKSVLQSQLEEFSKDQDQWDRLRPGMHRPHKGSHTVTGGGKKKTSRPKLSAQRLTKLRGDREPNVTVHDGHNAVERSKDLHTPQEVSEIIPWAQAIIAKHPYRPESEVTTSGTVPARPGSSGVFLPQLQTESTISSIASEIAQKVSVGIIAQLDAANMVDTCDIASDSSCAESLMVPSSDSESMSHAVDETHHLKLGDGTKVSFVVNNVPDPVAVTFKENIPRLNAMWDDTSPYWKEESVLMIEGRPIPIVYWSDVYHYGKYGQWQGTKSQWTGWRDVISRYRQSTPEDFWNEFSVNGRAMKFTKIVDELRRQRNISNDDIVTCAREEFGNTFNSLFTYRKGDKVHVMRNKSAIARHYRQLKKHE